MIRDPRSPARLMLALLLVVLGHHALHSQALLWKRFLDTDNGYGAGGMVLDGAGNVYLAFEARGFEGRKLDGDTVKWGLMKVDPDGRKRWTRTWGKAKFNGVVDLAAGQHGDLIIVGRSEGAAIALFDSAGNRKWTWNLPGGRSGFECAAVDGSGNVYAAGYADTVAVGGTFTGQKTLLVKFGPDGKKAWTKVYGTENGLLHPGGIAADPKGNLYLVGRSTEDKTGGSNLSRGCFFLMKIDGTGEQRWIRRLGPEQDGGGSKVWVEPDGRIGATWIWSDIYQDRDSASTFDLTWVEHDSGGTLLGTRNLASSLWELICKTPSRDPEGNLHAAMMSSLTPPKKDHLGNWLFRLDVVKIGPDGKRRWTTPLPEKQFELARGLAVDAQGFTYLFGNAPSPHMPGGEMFLMKVAPYAPSFDCGKATTMEEYIICGSATLSRLDDSLARVYSEAYKAASDKGRLRKEQLDWVESERNGYSSPARMESTLLARIETLKKRSRTRRK